MKEYQLIRDTSPTSLKILNDQLRALWYRAKNTSEKDILPNSIDTIHIKDGAVTNDKILAVNASKITAGTLDADKVLIIGTLFNIILKSMDDSNNGFEIKNGNINFYENNELKHTLSYNRYIPSVHFDSYIDANGRNESSNDFKAGIKLYGKVYATTLEVSVPSMSAGQTTMFDNIALTAPDAVNIRAVASAYINSMNSNYYPAITGFNFVDNRLHSYNVQLYALKDCSETTVRLNVTIVGGE